MRAHASDWLPLATPVVGLLGFLVYAISAGGYQAFFRQFNVSLDEVGLGQASVVEQAGVHLVSWLVSLGIFVGLFLGIEVVVVKRFGKWSWERFPWLKKPFMSLKRPFTSLGEGFPWLKKPFTWVGKKLGGNIIRDSVLVASASIFFRLSIRSLLKVAVLRVGRGEPLLRPLGQSLPFHLALPLLAFVDLGIISVWDIRPQPGRKSLWVWLLVISAVGFTVLAHSDVVAEGQKDALCAQSGGAIESPMLGITADQVTIEWADGTLSKEYSQDRFLFLGNGKMLVLYDLSTHPNKTVRVPADTVTDIYSLAPSPSEDNRGALGAQCEENQG
jgi:hypothetical protein